MGSRRKKEVSSSEKESQGEKEGTNEQRIHPRIVAPRILSNMRPDEPHRLDPARALALGQLAAGVIQARWQEGDRRPPEAEHELSGEMIEVGNKLRGVLRISERWEGGGEQTQGEVRMAGWMATSVSWKGMAVEG